MSEPLVESVHFGGAQRHSAGSHRSLELIHLDVIVGVLSTHSQDELLLPIDLTSN